MKITIFIKIIAGYAVLAAFLLAAAGQALHYLHDVAAKAETIFDQRMESVAAVRSLQTAMAAMELCERTYAEAPSNALLNLFQFHHRQFDGALLRLALTSQDGADQDLKEALNRYFLLFDEQLKLARQGQLSELRERSATVLAQQAGIVHGLLDSRRLATQRDLDRSLASLREVSSGVSSAVLYTALFGVFIGLALAFLVATQISAAIRKLREATFMVGQGHFDLNLRLRGRDELQDLAACFEGMAQKLKMSEQLCLDASPLTYLPGNIAIERALSDRVRRNHRFALCYLDLDDFKAFNDRHGYASGSEVIKAVAELLHHARKEAGRENDFIGHIGGDDFVYLTDPDNIVPVCETIIRDFDAMIPSFYSEEDRARGYIMGVDRYGEPRKYPLMTLSIAVVSDAERDIRSPLEIARVAAEIKEYVKTLPGSNYLVDRRRGTR